MAQKSPQNFANHTQEDWIYIGAGILLLIGTIAAIVAVFRDPSLGSISLVIIAIGTILAYVRIRPYALMLQDRLVRDEMLSRLPQVLPDNMKGRISELSLDQLIALRFASDHEMPDLVVKVLTEKITKRSDIKKLIKNWQADHMRV